MTTLNFNESLIDKIKNNKLDNELDNELNNKLDDSSVILYEKTLELSNEYKKISYPMGDILVGYKSNNIEPVNVILKINNRVHDSIELKYNEFIPILKRKYYLPLVSMQYTYVYLSLNELIHDEKININLIFAKINKNNKMILVSYPNKIGNYINYKGELYESYELNNTSYNEIPLLI